MSARPPARSDVTPADTAEYGVAHPQWAADELPLPALLEGLEARRRTGPCPMEIADVLGSVGERFLRPGSLRQAALEALVEDPGYSKQMAKAVLDGMAREWSVERLRRLVASEFPAAEAGYSGPAADWVARSPALHVCAGNVPGVSVTSLIRALLVGSAVIVKPGRSDRALPVLFHRALEEEAPGLAATAAVHYCSAGTPGLSDVTAKAALLVVYGGSEAIRWARQSAGPTTFMVEYPHRVSVLLVTPDGLKSDSIQPGARSAALAVALFEQRGCVSPQAVYVVPDADADRGLVAEADPENRVRCAAEAWAECLAVELDRLETVLAPGRRTAAEASAFHQEVGAAEMATAGGSRARLWGTGTGWRVVLESSCEFKPSCLGRFIRVHPVTSFDVAVEQLGSLAPLLQTVGVVGSVDSEQRARLVNAGALRITSVEDVPWPPAWARLDGIEPLRSLVRWSEGD